MKLYNSLGPNPFARSILDFLDNNRAGMFGPWSCSRATSGPRQSSW